MQKRELWDRWKAGESIREISRALGRPPGSIFTIIKSNGGYIPPVRQRRDGQLTLAERESISRGLARGDSMREIARCLGRAVSTVSREIARDKGPARYRAVDAEDRTWDRARRRQPCLLATNTQLRDFVTARLAEDWSPEQISPRSWCGSTAGATHELIKNIEALNTARRTVRYLVGSTITDQDETAIAKLPERMWEAALRQDGEIQEGYGIAELTGLNTRTGWPAGMRLLVRRVKPSGRHAKKLTTYEARTGFKYSIVATNIGHMWDIAGSHQPQFLDALARSHAMVEARLRVGKATGLRNLPARSGRSTRPGCSPRTSATTWTAGSASSPCTTKKTSPAPSRTPYATASTASRPTSTAIPAAAGSASTAPGPGPKPSPWPGNAPPSSRPHPDSRSPPRRTRKKSRPGPVEPGAPTASRDGLPHRHPGQTGHPAKTVTTDRTLKDRG
ncbi:DNA-binding CsgD family transcriptional regulator [Kitasatospora sp. GAS204A]|nr:DNA-binding CsgD family transcriptional regulator [Kitasatospora sp. GAS204B]